MLVIVYVFLRTCTVSLQETVDIQILTAKGFVLLVNSEKKIMADKSKKPCQGKDTFERINFLYQAASQISNKSHILSCYYGQQCRSISKKTLQRM